jgi:HEAT repeat protein
MKTMNLKALVLGTLFAAATFVAAGDARSDNDAVRRIYGKQITDDQIEFVSTGDHIKAAAANGAPMLIWEALEHGEKVECLDCIPSVEPLLYDANARTREIAAWWLRRRMIGVFGPGEVYQRTLNTLATDSSPQKRAYAAYAIGEFLAAPGIAALATALGSDGDATVRAAAASALGRLGDDGAGALGKAMADADSRVKIAALGSAGRINTFTGVANIAAMLGDGDATVRRRALELLDAMKAKDSVAAVLSLAQNDSSADVRGAACHALGAFRDPSARVPLQTIADNDASSLVRDMAKIALRSL